jgi:hypothetical protein
MQPPDYSSLIPIRDLPAALPRGSRGKKIHKSTIYRWILRGVRGVRLRTTSIGGMTFVSPEDLAEFIRLLSSRASQAELPSVVSAAVRRRQEAAARFLDERGI